MRNLILSLTRLVLLILFFVLILINRMERPREHRHIIEIGLSLLTQAHMPLKYWDEAFLVVTFLINHTPSKVINYATPLE
jgi:hypothetical protein